MAISKVVFGSSTLIDLTMDDVTVADVISGKKFHLPDGSDGVGTNTWDADTKDATAAASEILLGKTAYVNATKLTGIMPNIGAQIISITTASTSTHINSGYHDGSGYAQIASTELVKLIPTNIRQGVELLGVTGTMSSEEGVNATTMVATPSKIIQSITPPSGYNYLTQVTINPIPYSEADAPQGGGKIATIG